MVQIFGPLGGCAKPVDKLNWFLQTLVALLFWSLFRVAIARSANWWAMRRLGSLRGEARSPFAPWHPDFDPDDPIRGSIDLRFFVCDECDCSQGAAMPGEPGGITTDEAQALGWFVALGPPETPGGAPTLIVKCPRCVGGQS